MKAIRMRDRSSSSTILIILILFITFPLWLALGGALFGVIAGLFGALIGVFGGLLGMLIGGLFTLIALPFKILFRDWGLHDFGSFDFEDHTLTILAVIFLIALVTRRQQTTN